MRTLGAQPHGSKPIRIVLADDQLIFRVGCRVSLEGYADFSLLGETTVAQSPEAVLRLRPDIVILGVTETNGLHLELVRRFTKDHPTTRVVLLSVQQGGMAARDALQAGAAGYLLRGCCQEELGTAIRIVAQQGTYVDRTLALDSLMAPHKSNSAGTTARFSLLSPQERKLLPLLAAGKTNKEIAADMNLSEKTVKNYLVRLYRKCGVTRRSQAASLFVASSRHGT